MAVEAEPEVAVATPQTKVAKNAAIYVVAQLLSWTVSFLSISIVPRRLGEVAIGELTVAGTLVSTVVATLMLSIDAYLMAEVGRKREETERLLGAALGLRIAMVLPLILISLLVLYFAHVSPTTWFLGYFAIVSAIMYLFSEPLRSTLAGWEEARRVSTVDLVNCVSPLLAIPFLAYGPSALSIAAICTAIIGVGLLSYWTNSLARLRPHVDLDLWKRLVLGGLPFFFSTFVIQFYSVGSVFILKHYTGDAAVGTYSQTIRLQGTFLFIPTAIGLALLPSLSRLSDVDATEFRKMQTRVLVLMISLSLPVVTEIVLLAKPFTSLLYGEHRFLDMPMALRISALNLIPLYITTILYRFLVAQRKNAIWSVFMVGTVLINAIGCMVFIPLTLRLYHNGPMGAMLASFVAEGVTVLFAFYLLKINPLNPDTIGRVLRGIVAALGMAGVILLTQNIFIVVPAALGVITFALLALVLRVFGDEEQQRLIELVRTRLLRRRA